MYAPIIVFVYNRPDRAKNLILSLSKNPEAINSELYIFSDGAKNEKSVKPVNEVRAFINTIEQNKWFKSVTITESKINKGLAVSIIDGVNAVMKKHGRAIIVEDDNIVATDFLDYMNRGLEFYKNDDSIWAISGFSRKMQFPNGYNKDVFLMQRVSSYTWASWSDRWNKVDWSLKGVYPKFLFDRKIRRRFAECGADRPLMLDAQVTGKINSWAIRFEYYMMKNNMYSIMPVVSRANCTGNDGSGTHGQKSTNLFTAELSDGKKFAKFETVEQLEEIRKEYIKPYRLSWKRKLTGNLEYIFRYFWRKINGK